MSATLTIWTRVLPGHRIEVVSPELPEGQEAEVTVTLKDAGATVSRRELLKLSVEERRKILSAQAERMAWYYEQPDPDRDAWQGGDIVE